MPSNRGSSSPMRSAIDREFSTPTRTSIQNQSNLKTPPRPHSHGTSTISSAQHKVSVNAHNSTPSLSTTQSNSIYTNTVLNSNKKASSDPQELTLFVQDLLQQMQSKFNTMGDSIIGRIDEMGNRIDDLEKSISDLMEQAGMDHPNANGLIMSPSNSIQTPTDGNKINSGLNNHLRED